MNLKLHSKVWTVRVHSESLHPGEILLLQTLYQTVSDTHVSNSASSCTPISQEEMSWCPPCLPEWLYLNLRAPAPPKASRKGRGRCRRHLGAVQKVSQCLAGQKGLYNGEQNQKFLTWNFSISFSEGINKWNVLLF